MAVSEKKRAANVVNGRKGGPKTSEGKEKSKMNGLKHGLRAEVAVLPGEDREAFNHRLRAWSHELQPKTEIERYLVESAVSASWRRDRCLRVETAVLTDRVLDAEDPDDEVAIREAEHIATRLLDDPEGVTRQLRQTSAGVRWMLDRCAVLERRYKVNSKWELTEKNEAVALMGSRPNEVFTHDWIYSLTKAFITLQCTTDLELGDVRYILEQTPPPGISAWEFGNCIEHIHKKPKNPEDSRLVIEALIARLRTDLESRLARLEAVEARHRTRAADRSAFDDSAEGKARLRYESMHERAFRSALRDLRAEQAARSDRGDDPGPLPAEPDAPTEPTEATMPPAPAEPDAPTEPTEGEAPAESEAPTEPTEPAEIVESPSTEVSSDDRDEMEIVSMVRGPERVGPGEDRWSGPRAVSFSGGDLHPNPLPGGEGTGLPPSPPGRGPG